MNASQSLSYGTHPETGPKPETPAGVPRQRVSAPTKFSIAIGRALGTVVVTIHGEIDRSHAPHLKKILEDLIKNQENLRVVVDLHDVAHLDPEAATALLDAINHSHQRGGAVTLNEPSTAVYESLEGSALVDRGMADVIPLSDHSRPRRPTGACPAPPPHPPAMAHHPSTKPHATQTKRAQGDSDGPLRLQERHHRGPSGTST